MKKILAIDDQKDNLLTVRALLTKFISSCEVLIAQSGKEGLEIAKKEQPDIILLDIIMPKMDGYEVCKKLKEDETTRHIPIIMLTAILNDTKSKIKGLETGADAFLTKPIEPNELSAQINVMFRIKKAEDKLRAERELLDKKVKERTEKLRESEGRYCSLIDDVLDTSSIGIFILDSDFKVVWINSATEKYFGLKREDVIGKDKQQLIQLKIKNIFEDPVTFRQKVFATYRNNTYMENFECHVLAEGDREERWLEHWSQPIKTGLYKGGRIEHYSDITERKQAEKTILEGEQFLTSLFESVQDGISVLNPDLTIRHVNGIMNKWYKENLPLEGKKCYETYHNADKPCDPCPTIRCLESGNTEWNVVKGLPGSSIEWIELYSYPIKEPGSDKVTGVVEFVRDITERKQTEAELAKYREHLEELVQERTKELEEKNEKLKQFNKLFVDREFRIKELKDKIKELEGETRRSK